MLLCAVLKIPPFCWIAVFACLVLPGAASSQQKTNQSLQAAQVELARKLCKEGRIDLFARFFASLDASVDDAQIWDELIEYANQLHKSLSKDKEYRLVEYENRVPMNVRKFLDDFRPLVVTKPLEDFAVEKFPRNSAWLIRAKSVSLGGQISRSLIVAAEDATFPGTIPSTVIIAGGSVRSEFDLHNCIVIAGGSISVKRAIGCILISREKISCDKYAVGCLLSTNSNLVRGTRSGLVGNCVVKENQKEPFLGIRFFNLGSAGLQVKEIALGVRAERIDNNVFKSSGLLEDDIIVEVDETRVTSVGAFSAALYSRIGNRSFRIKVLRGKDAKTLTINVLDFVRELK